MKDRLVRYDWLKTVQRVHVRNKNGVCHFRKGGHSKFEDLTYLAIAKVNKLMTEMECHISGPAESEPFHVELFCFNYGGGIDFEIRYISNISADKAIELAVEALIGLKLTAFRKPGGGGMKKVGHYLANNLSTSDTSKENLRDAFDKKLISEQFTKKVVNFEYGMMRVPSMRKKKKKTS